MWAMTSAGRLAFLMMFAIVNVLPEPVTPSNTWCFMPFSSPSVSFAMAWGWSPVGAYSECSLNMDMACSLCLMYFSDTIIPPAWMVENRIEEV